MPLQLPVLDDRNFEQLLEEAKRRIPAHTPEWTNFDLESDPGITIVQLFAFLTDSLLFRANRVPERNRLKFLQLLGIPLQKAAAAEGVIAIRNERGPLETLTLQPGVVVAAGAVNFLTRDGVTVLPVEAQVYYKRRIPETDPRHQEFTTKFEAVRTAMSVAVGQATTGAPAQSAAEVDLDFYETLPMPAPTPGVPNPVVDLANETIDRSLYVALLSRQNEPPEDARQAIANKTLSLGVAPALADQVPPLAPQRRGQTRSPLPDLVYEIADTSGMTPAARYSRLRLVQQSDALNQVGVVQVALPGVDQLQKWEFSEPLQEGTGDFPPRLEDEKVAARLITWLRLRLPLPGAQPSAAVASLVAPTSQPESLARAKPVGTLNARLTWVGVNAARVTQAVPVTNELLGVGNGEPDQTAALANTPVLEASARLEVQDENNVYQFWRLTDDLLAARADEKVFTLDPESGQIRFGDGLRGARPLPGKIIRASYEYGGGAQGNVSIGAIKNSPDPRLQGGYKIENPVPTWGGDMGESVAEAERDIPRHLRHRDRLVTARDFEDITRRASGVDMGRVETLPLFHPTLKLSDAPGLVTVLVIPRFDALNPLWPAPDRLFLRKVCDYLEPRRLLTTEVHVRGPDYVPIYISVGVRVRAGFFRDVALQAVTQRLNVYLSSLPPGGPEGRGWPLNKPILQKDLEAVVTRVAGVDFVESLELGARASLGVTEVPFSGLELPRLAALSVVEGLAEPLSSVVSGVEAAPTHRQVVPVPVTRKKC